MDDSEILYRDWLSNLIHQAEVDRGTTLPPRDRVPGNVALALDVIEGLRAAELRTVATRADLSNASIVVLATALNAGLPLQAEKIVALMERLANLANSRNLPVSAVAGRLAVLLAQRLYDEELLAKQDMLT